MWKVSPNPVKPKKAIEFFRSKSAIPKESWDKLDAAGRHKAFTVANVAQLDVVSDVWKELDKAVANGSTMAEFKAAVAAKLENEWAGTVKAPGNRVETIFRTNIQSAYSAGRYAQMTDPAVKADRPMWMFDATMDGRTTDLCSDLNGTIRPASDPWWHSHTPPLHHQCRSQVIALTAEQAASEGGSTPAPKLSAASGFGAPPATPADDDWKPSAADYPAALWTEYQAKSGGAPPR